MRLAVVGHVEWVEFLAVDQLPHPGAIGHALRTLQEPAGGGAVVAVQMARLQQQPVQFFTALGRDSVGEACVKRLKDLGLEVHVAWREAPTRRGVSMVDAEGDRAITVIGERLTPSLDDDLPWEALGECDGLFVTAADAPLLKACRSAAVLAATPRVRLPVLQQAGVQLDALIGSGLDPGERVEPEQLNPAPCALIRTEGAAGGSVFRVVVMTLQLCLGLWSRVMAAATALRPGWSLPLLRAGHWRRPSLWVPSVVRLVRRDLDRMAR